MNALDPDSIHNIIITENESVAEEIHNIKTPAKDIEVIDVYDSDDDVPNKKTKDDFPLLSVTSQYEGNTPYKVIAVNDINDLKQIHAQFMTLGVLPRLPLSERNKLTVDEASTKQPINPSRDTINIIRNRYKAITTKQNLAVENNNGKIISKNEDAQKEIDSLEIDRNTFSNSRTGPNNVQQSTANNKLQTCLECAASFKRIKSLEDELRLMKFSVEHVQWKLTNARKTIKYLRTRLRRREIKLVKWKEKQIKEHERQAVVGDSV